MAVKKTTKKAKEKVRHLCGICGGTISKHHKHCPVPKLTKNQVNWIVGICFTTGERFPLF